MYLMDAGQMTGSNPFPEGAVGRSTPTLHVVVDGVIVQSVEGTDNIMEVLDQVEAGSHEDYSN